MKNRQYLVPFALFMGFEVLAVALWLALDNTFYLFNFSYIGICLSGGLALFARKADWARRFVLFAVGIYMLAYLGLAQGENMQIEGFWYYLGLGVFEGATIHYLVAKILGPFLFGRGWCGYACWTAMVLECLPYKVPVSHARKKLGWIRYAMFAASLVFVSALLVLQVPNASRVMFWAFVAGNALYYLVGIAMAYAFKDNRAFCKYVCPITVFLKAGTSRAVLHVKVDEEKCVHCGQCTSLCPMDVEVPNNSRRKANATECILCLGCVKNCPAKALHI